MSIGPYYEGRSETAGMYLLASDSAKPNPGARSRLTSVMCFSPRPVSVDSADWRKAACNEEADEGRYIAWRAACRLALVIGILMRHLLFPPIK